MKREMIHSYLDDQKRSPVLVECQGHDEIYSSLVYKSGCCLSVFLSEGVFAPKKRVEKVSKNEQKTTEKNATNM